MCGAKSWAMRQQVVRRRANKAFAESQQLGLVIFA
jgi:hypothetical protein